MKKSHATEQKTDYIIISIQCIYKCTYINIFSEEFHNTHLFIIFKRYQLPDKCLLSNGIKALIQPIRDQDIASTCNHFFLNNIFDVFFFKSLVE
jgi:hypothetical protein